jgi:hypothetical protein
MKKILSKLTVFVLAAAVMLFSCEKDGTEGTDLRIVSDNDVIQANGKFTATKVMYTSAMQWMLLSMDHITITLILQRAILVLHSILL